MATKKRKNFKKPLAFPEKVWYSNQADLSDSVGYPGVAKFGIALEWGSRGLEFESQHSDHNVETKQMSPAKSPITSGFFAAQTAIFLCTKTQM